MKTSSAKKSKSLEAVLANVESGMAEVVAAIVAERKRELAARRRRARAAHHDAAHAA